MTARTKPKLTREHLAKSLLPVNNCRVAAFAETLGPDEREIFEEALGYSARDYSARQIRDLLLAAEYPESDLPGEGAIADHRAGRRPCRCRG